MLVADSFRLQNCNYLFSKHAGQKICSLLTFFNVPVDGVLFENLEKCTKSLKTGEYWAFCPFRCQFETFSFRRVQ